MIVEIDGKDILSETSFHEILVKKFSLSKFYGRNLDALLDFLGTDVERPLVFIWKNSNTSRINMGEQFDTIVNVLRIVERQDIEWGLTERFELKIE